MPLRDCNSAWKQRECAAPLSGLFSTPQPLHGGSHGTLAAVPQLWVSSSPFASCAQPAPSLCQKTGVLTGNLPGPQSHSQTPAASKPRMSPIPFSVLSLCSRLSHPPGHDTLSWPDPSCREPQALLGLPPLGPTPSVGHVHSQRAKNPTWQTLPIISKSPRAPQAECSTGGAAWEPGQPLCVSGQALELSLLDTGLGTGVATSPHRLHSDPAVKDRTTWPRSLPC